MSSLNLPRRRSVWISLSVAAITLTLAILILKTLPSRGERLLNTQASPVSLQGQVTYINREDNVLFLQNESGSYRVDAAKMPAGLEKGQDVRLVASVEPPAKNHNLQAITVKLAAATAKIKPVLLSSSDLRRNLSEESQQSKHLVDVTGIVREAHFALGGLAFRLRVEGTDVKVRILERLSLQPETAVNSKLRVRGVLDVELGADGKTMLPLILVQQADADHVEIQQPAELMENFSVTTIGTAAKWSPHDQPQRIRLRGTIGRSGSGELWLKDGTGQVAIKATEDVATDTESDAWGYIKGEGGSLELEDAVLLDGEKSGQWKLPGESPGTRLTTVEAVHKLPTAIAGLKYPVTLHGVITFVFPDLRGFFLQDNTDGLFVGLGPQGNKLLHAGQRAVVTGRTAEGGFAPTVPEAAVTVEGVGHFPKPANVDLSEIMSGRQDSKWIELEGIIHSVVYEDPFPYATAELAGNFFDIYLPKAEDLSSSLVDAKVRVRGVCATVFNSRRQLRGIKLFVPGAAFINLLSAPPPADQLSIKPIADLEHFSMQVEPGHRLRVQAVVTKVGRKGRIFLRDTTGALRADLTQESTLNAGDLVNAVGFLRRDAAGPVLSEVSTVLLRRNVPLAAQLVSAEELLEEGYEAQLVELRATLLDHVQTQGIDTLLLKAGRIPFRAVLGQGRIADAAKGSFLRVRGVAELQGGSNAYETPITLLLRSPQDVIVLQSAPWWDSETLGWALLAIGGLTSLVIAWALLLRRRVTQQTQVIRDQLSEAEHLQAGAEAASRAKGEFLTNMSHEIRTPLNGVLGMTEIALMEPLQPNVREYLEIARESGLGLLQVINDVLDMSKIEAGRMTIEIAPLNLWDLLQQSMSQFKVAAEQKGIGLHLEYPVHAARNFQGDVVRIRQILLNLLSNAMKFTKEGEVRVRMRSQVLDDQRRSVRIEVHDTGIGIAIERQAELFRSFEQADTSTTRKYGGTGLGLSISKQLVELMGGTITCASQPGEGSVFSVELPLLLGPSPERDAQNSTESASALLPLQSAVAPASFDVVPVHQ